MKQLQMVEVLDHTKMKEDNYIVKANKFIEAKGRLSLMEQKIYAALISTLDRNDEEFKRYRVNIKEFGELIKYDDKKIYQVISETITKLQGRTLKFEIKDEKGRRSSINYNLVASSAFAEGKKYAEFTIHPDLKPYLIAIKGKENAFTKYTLRNILRLNSAYSIRLYELLKSHEFKGSIVIDLQFYREFFGVENKYPKFADFEKRLLKDPVDEINGKKHENGVGVDDIRISYEKIKKGRNITAIKFSIESIKGITNADLYEDEELKKIKERSGLCSEAWSHNQVLALYEIAVQKTTNETDPNVNPYDYIRLNYQKTSEKSSVRNRFGYLKNSLENDHGKAVVLMRMKSLNEEPQ